MNLLSSGPSHADATQCTWTMDNIFRPASSPQIISKPLSCFNHTPLWILLTKNDFRISHHIPPCLVGLIYAPQKNYTFIPLPRDGKYMVILFPFESSQNVIIINDFLAYPPLWILSNINFALH